MSQVDANEESRLAWSSEGYEAAQYIRARPPYPKVMVDLVLNYHRKFSSSASPFEAALDLGCGPGQLALHLAQSFPKVYGVDPIQRSLDLAETLQNFTPEQGAQFELPTPPPKPIDFKVGSAKETALPDQSVDLILSGASAHWWGLENPEKREVVWNELARILRPGGTVALVIHQESLGTAKGVESPAAKDFKEWTQKLIREPLFSSYIPAGFADRLLMGGGASGYGLLPLPTDAEKWDIRPESRFFLNVDVLPMYLQNGPKSDPIPDWAPQALLDYDKADSGSLISRKTTPKAGADLLRSASFYIRYLGDHPEEKELVATDDDWAGKQSKELCAKHGLGLEDQIETYIGFTVVLFRRKA